MNYPHQFQLVSLLAAGMLVLTAAMPAQAQPQLTSRHANSSDWLVREQRFNSLDAGDGYNLPSGRRTLHRMAGAVVVQLQDAKEREVLAQRLTAAGGALNGFEADTNRMPAGDFMIFHAPAAQRLAHSKRADVLDERISQTRRANGVRHANPLFLDPKTGMFLAARSEVVVRLKPGVDAPRHFGAEWNQVRRLRGMPDYYVVTIPQTAAAEIFAESDRRATLPDVAWAEPSFQIQIIPQAVPNDTYYGKQWHLKNTGQTGAGVSNVDIKAEQAWDITTGATNIIVAVLDQAIQISHPDLAPNLRTNFAEIAGNGIDDDKNGYIDDVVGWNFADTNNNVNPVAVNENHGTSVAGLAVGRGNNALGVAGVAYTSKLLPVKTLGASGSPPVTSMAEAIAYAASIADVMNLSLAFSTGIQLFDDAFQAAATQGRGGRGCVIVAGAGNFDYQWERAYIRAGAGNHTISWTYFWNNSTSITDQIYLGEVRLPGGPTYQLGVSNGTTLPAGWTLSGTPWTNVASASESLLSGAVLGALRSPALSGAQSSTISITWNNSNGSPADGHFDYRMANDSSAYVNCYLDGVLLWGRSGRGSTAGGVVYPAAHPKAIAIGAITDQNRRAAYSQFGDKLDVVAPSIGGIGGLWATDRTGADGYNADTTITANNHPDYVPDFGGTSAATPIVAGVAALILSVNPNLSAEDVRYILRETAVKTGPVTYTNGRSIYLGSGLVNAAAAVQMATNYFILPPDTKTGYVRGRTLNLTNATISIGTNLGNTTLNVNNDGVLLHGAAIIGQAAASDTNTVIVGGTGARWSVTNTLTVGDAGSENRLLVQTGGVVTSSTLLAGAQAASTTNFVQLVGGSVTNSTATDIRRGTLALNSGTLSAGLLRLTNSAGRVSFSGGTLITAGASISNGQSFIVGNSGSATSIWNANLSASPTAVQSNLVIGGGAPGVLNILNGERVEAHGRTNVNMQDGSRETSVSIGGVTTAAGSAATVSGAGSMLWAAGHLVVGENSPFNSLTISDGGRVESEGGIIGAITSGRSNVVTVTGSGSVWTNRNALRVGNGRNYNRLVIENGGRVDDVTAYLGYDEFSFGNEAVVMNGGVWSNSASLTVGQSGTTNAVRVQGGTVSVRNLLLIGSAPSATGNRLEVSSGSVLVKNATTNGILEVRRGTNSFSGGLMDVDQLLLTNSAGLFEFNGGTLITRGGTINNGQDFIVGRAGSTVDSRWVVPRTATPVNISGRLIIGTNGSVNILEVTNGGAVNVSGPVIIGANPAGPAWLKVADVGSSFSAASIDVRRGSNVLDGGSIDADSLLLTSAQGRFGFTEGMLALNRATVGNGLPFHVGDGVTTATYFMSGTNDLHSFANGLVVTNKSFLKGNGTISGTVTIRGGATLSPGASVGVITMSNSPALQGRVVMEISTNGVGITNDQLRVLGALTYGGALVVTNLGPTPTNGSRYVLFTATNFAGSFNNFTFPTLPPPLTWTNKLLVDGSIQVISGTPFFSELGWWRGGESDPGAANSLGTTSTANEYGGALNLLPSATYSSNVAASAESEANSQLALQFAPGSYGTNPLVTTAYDNFGIELWVKPDVTNATRCLAYNGIPNSTGWGLYINNGQYRGLFGGISYIGATAPVLTNVWTHLAFVRDNGVATLYVNGVANASFTNSPNLPTTRFTVAANLGADQFAGKLDEIRVFTFAPGTFSTNELLIVPTLLVTTTANSGPGSLRDVVAATPPGGRVRFATNLSGQTITLASEIVLSNSVEITAANLPAGVTINGGGATRLFYLLNNAGITMNSLTLTGGNGAGAAPTIDGGAMYIANGSLTMTRCTLSGNSVPGGPRAGGAIQSYGSLILDQCTLSGNSAGGAGGAIRNDGVAWLTQCTFSGNTAGAGGGAIYSANSLTLIQCTLTENSGNRGGGIYYSAVFGDLVSTNSIIAGNTGTITNPNILGSFSSSVSNLTSGNPLLAPLGYYGGPMRTRPPLPGSPAINAGNNSVTNSLAADQRGGSRLLGAHVDIGAVEGAFSTNFPIANLTRLGNGNVQFNFANLSGPTYSVLASTNVAAPLNAWTNLGAPTESPFGVFTFTDLQATNHPRRFYRVIKP